MIEAIIFDMGGVIMRTQDHAPRRALAERLGLGYEELALGIFDGPQSLRAQLGEITAEDFWKAAGAMYGMEPQALMAEFFKGDIIDHELVAAIRSYRARYKTGLLSNSFSDLRYWMTEDWKIADAFHQIVVSAEVKMRKPDPAIYAYALAQLGVHPQTAVFVDDLAVNIEAAQKVGLHAIQFSTREQTLAELQTLLGAA